MKIFTYQDYLQCLKVLQKNENGDYVLKESLKHDELIQKKSNMELIKVDNKYDKTFKIILEDKEEAANFINKILEFDEKIKAEDLEKYNKSFITKNYKIQEADIIYKLKNKKVFILIEHQTKVDYSMPFRILNYQMEVMRSCIEKKKVKNKNYKQALVIAIVLYTGKQKWTAKTYIKEIQENLNLHKNNKKMMPTFGNYMNLGNYNIVDINNFTKKKLLGSKNLLPQIMLLEKSRDQEELLENLEKIRPNIKEENKETVIQILRYALVSYFDENRIREITRKIEKEEGDNMLAMVEMLKMEKQKQKREVKRGLMTGRRMEKISLAKKMLKENFAVEIIEKITGLKREKFM